ncbi:A24 family peptidase [Desulfococcaceae bacterium HSG9]|nr:A24 family peptidase [Desulfococcaceae bacterium HSG9]
MENYLIYLAITIFGLCVGSFLNVCIYRIPDDSKSINHPSRSICLNCGYTLKFYDNIPVLSYILLKGRCRQCQASISWRYPLVELLTGLGAISVFLKSGMTFATLIYFIFIACLLVITFIDLDHRIIPDVITLPGIPVFFVMALAVPDVTLKDSLIGLLIGGGSLWAVAFIYKLVTGKDGMGGGDIKLLAMMGVLIGWQGVLFTIFISSAIGTVTGLAVMLVQKGNLKLAVPFGPFLAIGAISYIFFGQQLIYWYLNLLSG